jgi:hypothetical protein
MTLFFFANFIDDQSNINQPNQKEFNPDETEYRG